MTRWAGFRQTKRTGPSTPVGFSQESDNCTKQKTMLEIALLCARQDVALRGHDESDKSDNKGNFREILFLLVFENASLKQQIDTAPSNAKYSKQSQNDGICRDIQSAHFFR